MAAVALVAPRDAPRAAGRHVAQVPGADAAERVAPVQRDADGPRVAQIVGHFGQMEDAYKEEQKQARRRAKLSVPLPGELGRVAAAKVRRATSRCVTLP